MRAGWGQAGNFLGFGLLGGVLLLRAGKFGWWLLCWGMCGNLSISDLGAASFNLPSKHVTPQRPNLKDHILRQMESYDYDMPQPVQQPS